MGRIFKEGNWPDCDMLPLGHIGIKSVEHGVGDRKTRFTENEQVLMMTLWCIFRSPLMMGGHLPDNDKWTLDLLTNEEILEVHKNGKNQRELFRNGIFNTNIAWVSEGDNCIYLALFNIGNAKQSLEISFEKLDIKGFYLIRDLWAKKDLYISDNLIVAEIEPHGAKLLKLIKK